MTEFIGMRTRLKPGMAEAYEKAHAELWPELLTVHRELGIRRWLIFRHGLEEAFHAVECEDFERASAALAQHPLDQRWQQHMAPYVVAAEDGAAPPQSGCGWPPPDDPCRFKRAAGTGGRHSDLRDQACRAAARSA